MKKMLGIDYDEKNRIFMIFELEVCDCGNHFHKHLLYGHNKVGVLKKISISLDKWVERHEMASIR